MGHQLLSFLQVDIVYCTIVYYVFRTFYQLSTAQYNL